MLPSHKLVNLTSQTRKSSMNKYTFTNSYELEESHLTITYSQRIAPDLPVSTTVTDPKPNVLQLPIWPPRPYNLQLLPTHPYTKGAVLQ